MQRSARTQLAAFAAAAAGALLSSAPARADVLATHCGVDALNAATAKLRLEWARACGTKINVVSPTAPHAPASSYNTGLLSANGGIPLWEYIETNDFWGKNSYSGVDAAVNQGFTQNQWRVGAYTATTDANGFQKWTEDPSLALARPTYPTFGNNLDINVATQLFPSPNYSILDCNLYLDPAGTRLANTSATGFYVNGYCSSSDTPCVAGASCTVDLSTCTEAQKASAWQGQSSLAGTLQLAFYTSHKNWVCQTAIPQAWPVVLEPGWWCGRVVNQCVCSASDACH